jgi:hypothetical protein
MPYTTRTAPNLRVYNDGGANLTLCEECVAIIRFAGPGTTYRHLDLSAPVPVQEDELQPWCEHCGRRGEAA